MLPSRQTFEQGRHSWSQGTALPSEHCFSQHSEQSALTPQVELLMHWPPKHFMWGLVWSSGHEEQPKQFDTPQLKTNWQAPFTQVR